MPSLSYHGIDFKPTGIPREKGLMSFISSSAPKYGNNAPSKIHFSSICTHTLLGHIYILQ